jgi:hypothetical protein
MQLDAHGMQTAPLSPCQGLKVRHTPDRAVVRPLSQEGHKAGPDDSGAAPGGKGPAVDGPYVLGSEHVREVRRQHREEATIEGHLWRRVGGGGVAHHEGRWSGAFTGVARNAAGGENDQRTQCQGVHESLTSNETSSAHGTTCC